MPPPAVEGPADWCAPGFEPIAGSACFAPPAAQSLGQYLVVYLHGRYAHDAAAEEIDRQRRLAARASARGFAVLAVRGSLGACSAPELASWYCWPTRGRTPAAAGQVVSAWAPALAAAQARVNSSRLFLLGFSNGGYFGGMVVTRGLLAVDAIAVAHAGAAEEPGQVPSNAPPWLLLSADDDVAQDDMIRLDEELTGVRWPHDSYARSGGHALSDGDIDAALTFFERSREPLPLRPALALHRAIRHVRDAAVGPDEADAGDGEGAGGETGGQEDP